MSEPSDAKTACEDDLRSRLTKLVHAELGTSIDSIDAVAAGLGSRRFFRLHLSGETPTAIARVDMPEDETLRPAGVSAEPPLEPIRAHLESCGLPAPRRLAAADGIELLEDVGDCTLEDVANGNDTELRTELYERAMELIGALQHAPRDAAVPNYARTLDDALFDYKADQICEWLIPSASGRATTAGERKAVTSAFALIREAAKAAPQRLAHRDFKAQNLHVIPEGPPRGRLVMIDLQGAFLAPPEYDAVCLLRDLHTALPEAEIHRLLAQLRPTLPDAPTEEDFKRRFNLLTLSRVGKDLSRFLYAIHERGDARYRAFLPNGIRSLQRAAHELASEPEIRNFAELIASLPEDACAR